jgi:hypothetical protein
MAKKFTRDMASDRDRFNAKLKEYEDETGKSLGDTEKLREIVLSDNYTIKQKSAGYNLLLVFKHVMELTILLEQEFQHDIFYAPAGSFFITCDNPVATFQPTMDGTATVGMGFAYPRTEILFPVNKRACLVLSRDGGDQRIQTSSGRVGQINGMIMGVAQKYVYASINTEQMARDFNANGCKVQYGENAFIYPQKNAPEVP